MVGPTLVTVVVHLTSLKDTLLFVSTVFSVSKITVRMGVGIQGVGYFQGLLQSIDIVWIISYFSNLLENIVNDLIRREFEFL